AASLIGPLPQHPRQAVSGHAAFSPRAAPHGRRRPAAAGPTPGTRRVPAVGLSRPSWADAVSEPSPFALRGPRGLGRSPHNAETSGAVAAARTSKHVRYRRTLIGSGPDAAFSDGHGLHAVEGLGGRMEA